MAGKWPPDWYMDIVNIFSPESAFLQGLIPWMDVRQFVYDFARSLVEWIPHSPPAYSKTVNQLVSTLAGDSTKVSIPIGTVGYNALTRQVHIEVNQRGGPAQQKMRIDVQSVFPLIIQLLYMVPWDFIGEAETHMLKEGMGMDRPPRAQDVVAWLYTGLRDNLSELGVPMPEIPGGFNSAAPSFAHIAIPSGTYTVWNGETKYEMVLPEGIVIAPRDSTTEEPQIVTGIAAVLPGEDENLAAGNTVTLELPQTVFGRDDLKATIIDFTDGDSDSGTPATMDITITNAKATSLIALHTLGNILLHNIPAMNASQHIYEGALELIEAIGHHPPFFTRNVYVDAVNVEYVYRVKQADNSIIDYSEMPAADALNGAVLTIVARCSDMTGLKEEIPLLTHAFTATCYYVDFIAEADGYDSDTAFSSALPSAIDLKAAETAAAAFESTVLAPLVVALKEAEAHLQEVETNQENPYSNQDKEDARADARHARDRVTLAQERHAALMELTKTENEKTLSGVRLGSPEEITFNHRVTVIAYEPGFDAVPDPETNGEFLPATKGRFRLCIEVVPGGKSTGVITAPSSYTDYYVRSTVPAVATATIIGAINEGVSLADIMDAGVSIDGDTQEALGWLDIGVKSVIHEGVPADETSSDPGGFPGSFIKLLIDIINDSDEKITLDKKRFTSPSGALYETLFSVPLAGIDDKVFKAEDVSSNAGVVLAPKGLIAYTGSIVSEEVSFDITGKPLAEIEARFAAPLHDSTVFARWYEGKELDYISTEINPSQAFENIQNKAERRFMFAQLRYKRYTGGVDEEGRQRVAKNWTVLTTENGVHPPSDCALNAMTITYNAVNRLLTLTNARNGESVTMYLNSTIWFMLQLCLLLPVEVF